MAVTFDTEKMDNLLREDNFLLHCFIKQMEEHSDYYKALEVVFNTFVIGDSVMERKYNNTSSEPKYQVWRENNLRVG